MLCQNLRRDLFVGHTYKDSEKEMIIAGNVNKILIEKKCVDRKK